MAERLLTSAEIAQQKQNAIINRQTLWEWKQRPCSDCGLLWHPTAMSYDHPDRKTVFKGGKKNFGSMMHYQPEMFKRQLRSCSPVCLNCHRVRELKRDIDDPKMPTYYREMAIKLLENCTNGALLGDHPNAS